MFLCFIIFTGCVVTRPDIPKYKVLNSDRIGYLVDIKNKNIEHNHLGTTVFNNFEKSYSYDWKIKEQIEEELKSQINVKLVNLDQENISLESLNNLIIANEKEWIINKQNIYDKLVNDLKLKAVIVINDSNVSLYLHPFLYTNKGSGLVSHHFIGFKKYFSVLGVDAKMYLLNPLGEIKYKNFPTFNMVYLSGLSSINEKVGFEVPNDIENITEKEFEPIKKDNSLLIKAMVGVINQSIISGE